MTAINVRHDEIHGAANLAISGVLRQEDRLPSAAQANEQRETRLEVVLPIDGEAQTTDVELQAAGGARDAELRNDRLLCHNVPFRRLALDTGRSRQQAPRGGKNEQLP